MSHRLLLGLLVVAALFVFVPSALAAPIVLTLSSSSGCASVALALDGDPYTAAACTGSANLFYCLPEYGLEVGEIQILLNGDPAASAGLDLWLEGVIDRTIVYDPPYDPGLWLVKQVGPLDCFRINTISPVNIYEVSAVDMEGRSSLDAIPFTFADVSTTFGELISNAMIAGTIAAFVAISVLYMFINQVIKPLQFLFVGMRREGRHDDTIPSDREAGDFN